MADQVPSIPEYDAEIPVSDDQLARLGKTAAVAASLQLGMYDLEKQIAELKRKHAYYVEKIIPEMMAEMGVREITTRAGLRVSVSEKMFATYPSDPEKQAASKAYLTATKNDGMIKRKYVVMFGRDSTESAHKFERSLAVPDGHERAWWSLLRESVARDENFRQYLDEYWPDVVPRDACAHMADDVSVSETIHHSTLLKFLREERASGRDVPLQDFGAFVREIAEIKLG